MPGVSAAPARSPAFVGLASEAEFAVVGLSDWDARQVDDVTFVVVKVLPAAAAG